MRDMSAATARADEDDLDRFIAEQTERNPEFPRSLEAAQARRQLLGRLTARRRALRIHQRDIAERLQTNQAAIARLEKGEHDPKLSTLTCYAAAVHMRLEVSPIDAAPRRSKDNPPAKARNSRS